MSFKRHHISNQKKKKPKTSKINKKKKKKRKRGVIKGQHPKIDSKCLNLKAVIPYGYNFK
jgi:hypothetical protein